MDRVCVRVLVSWLLVTTYSSLIDISLKFHLFCNSEINLTTEASNQKVMQRQTAHKRQMTSGNNYTNHDH